MQDLRFIERRGDRLIFATPDGSEFQSGISPELVYGVRAIERDAQPTPQNYVNPREVQTLLRQGVPAADIAEQLGAELADVQRYEPPIAAEFSFILDSARNVTVRSETHDSDEPQRFGAAIEERLRRLLAVGGTWSAWKHPEDGWMVALGFTSHDVKHSAVWSFDHRKSVLTPVTPDAVNLSKQGDVGDKLIPTLRVVDRPEEPVVTHEEVFNLEADTSDPDHDRDLAETGGFESPFLARNAEDEFERRQEIDQRAIATAPEAPADLGQTADLLDALRKRRTDREQHPSQQSESPEPEQPKNLFASRSVPSPVESPAETTIAEDTPLDPPVTPESAEKKAKRGRASIPSWDDILFGTRSDED